MKESAKDTLLRLLNQVVHPLTKNNYAALLEKIGDARIVLMGEATHGTHEFYKARAEITKQLIQEKNFMAIAIEGDWPDVHGIHRYLQGAGEKKNTNEALAKFKRFPIWMWRNKTLIPFLQHLRTHNDHLPAELKIGFYGLDIYSLDTSMQAVIRYLMQVDEEAANRARTRYECFDHLNADPQTYGYLTKMGIKKTCVDEAIAQLLEMQHHAFKYIKEDNMTANDEYFFATQNARVVKNAEEYYRAMFDNHVSSWNVRDTHMAETLNLLLDHLETRFKQPAKIVVWAHNSHIGDARATEMGERGELNIGQLVREQHQEATYSIGFSTYQGTVTAASTWDGPVFCKRVNPGLRGSYEALFHEVKYKNFLLDLHHPQIEHYLHLPRLQRAIGVIYRPDTERDSHYFLTHLPYQFDSVIHFDDTIAVEPLDETTEWQSSHEVNY